MENKIYNEIKEHITRIYEELKNSGNLDYIIFLLYIYYSIAENSPILSNFVQKIMLKKDKTNDFYVSLSSEKTISITLDFFKSFDSNLYQLALSFFTNQSNYNMQISDKLPESFFTWYESEILLNSQIIPIWLKNQEIQIKTNGNIDDVYTFAHEISHAFTYNSKHGLDPLLREIPSFFIETMLDNFLQKNNYVSFPYVYQRNFNRLEHIINLAPLQYGIFRFLYTLYRNEELTIDSIKNCLKKICVPENKFLINLERDVIKVATYDLAYLFTIPFFRDLYKTNTTRAYNTYTQLCLNLKNNLNFKQILLQLYGIKNQDDIKKLVQTCFASSAEMVNKYLSLIHKNNTSLEL